MEAGVFASLVTDDAIGKVTLGIEAAVMQSFVQDTAPGRIILVHAGSRGDSRITRSEVKRRGEICLKIFRCLRGDLKWGVDRILDHLAGYLRNELDGVSWEPEARRASWTAP